MMRKYLAFTDEEVARSVYDIHADFVEDKGSEELGFDQNDITNRHMSMILKTVKHPQTYLGLYSSSLKVLAMKFEEPGRDDESHVRLHDGVLQSGKRSVFGRFQNVKKRQRNF